jgi:hypothetical protein
MTVDMAVDGEKSIELRLLGNVEVELDGTVLALGHRQQRLLAALAVLGPRENYSFHRIFKGRPEGTGHRKLLCSSNR